MNDRLHIIIPYKERINLSKLFEDKKKKIEEEKLLQSKKPKEDESKFKKLIKNVLNDNIFENQKNENLEKVT